jgi:hypothetical protein
MLDQLNPSLLVSTDHSAAARMIAASTLADDEFRTEYSVGCDGISSTPESAKLGTINYLHGHINYEDR